MTKARTQAIKDLRSYREDYHEADDLSRTVDGQWWEEREEKARDAAAEAGMAEEEVEAILADGRVGLPMALSAAKAIYGRQFNPQVTLKALSYFGDGNLRALPRQAREALAEAVAAADLGRLPALDAPAGGSGPGR